MNKQYRVKKSQEIELIINEKKFSANSFFVVYKRKNSETSHFRYAISVGKKIGKAVIRNKVKRQIRSIIDLINVNTEKPYDVFIIVRPKVLQLSFEEMKENLEYLFNKQKLIIKGEKND
jgi:ribonuclease P protein component